MSNAKISQISIYPIKSTAGITLSSTWVEELGLAFDRRFVIADDEGQFISARTHPKLCLVQANLTSTGLILTAPEMPNIAVDYHRFNSTYTSVTVWKDTISAQQCDDKVNQWFSLFLNQACQLLFFGEHSQRFVKNRTSQVGFADGYPLLLISQASLDDLNNKIVDAKQPMLMSQFRPNIVVDDCEAFAEDSWQRIRIGEVEFEITKPCTRCIFTTVNPVTAEKHSQQEPLNTLKHYRQLDKGDILFGQNLVALNKGQIKQGDKIEILSKKTPPTFKISNSKSNADTYENQASAMNITKPEITFSSFNKTITGNNQQTLLDQGESAGLVLPHSCRAGLCGRCKVKLTAGNVQQSCNDGLTDEEQQQGYILTCSSIPTSDITITHPERKRRIIPEH